MNIRKYQALAYSTEPYGPKLQNAIEAHWNDWLQIVRDSNWIKYWTRYEKIFEGSCTPKGRVIDQKADDDWVLLKGMKDPIRVSSVALLIFTNAVWGWGIDDWLHNSLKQIGLGRPVSMINKSILDARKGLASNNFLEYHEGMLMPFEYADLDRWLEKLWNDVCIER